MRTRAVALAAVAALVLSSAAAAEDSEPKDDTRETAPADAAPAGEEQSPPSSVENRGSGRVRLSEVVVEAEKPLSAASSQEIREQDFATRPHATIQEILNNIPGIVVTQHQGGGKAYQYLVRGFDSDHGTDVAVWVDNVPVNMVSHAHGQGYADLNFVIPETIDTVRLYKGPYFIEYGDFDTAAALQFDLIDRFKENFGHAEGGYFQTMRYVAGASAAVGNGTATAAGQAYFNNGPFISPNDFRRYNLFLKYTFDPSPDSKMSIWGSMMKSTWNASGQIPNREVLDGDISRFGSEDNSEGGHTDREDVSAKYTNKLTPDDTLNATFYVTHYSLNLFSDFTFFKDSGLRFIQQPDGRIIDTRDAPVIDGANYIPGDGIQQTDGRMLFGGQIDYTKAWDIFGIASETKIGIQNRNDTIDLTLNRQVRRQQFFKVNNVHVWENSIGLFLGQQVFPFEWLRLDAGVRGDIFFFDVHNNGFQQAPDPNFYSVDIGGKTNDSITSAKANAVITPIDNTEIYLNFGTGFHSNDARATVPNTINSPDPETFVPTEDFAPLTRAIGTEIGARTKLFERLNVASALWLLDLDDELVFSGDGGTLEPLASRTRRWGVDFELRYQITDKLHFDYDLTWDDPRQVPSGLAVPLAPTLLMNGGVLYEWFEGFSTSLRVRYLDNRPGNDERTITVPGYTLVDILARYRWRNVELALDFLNVTDTAWDEAAFVFGTCVRNDEMAGGDTCNSKPMHNEQAGIDDINFTPGNPFNIRGGVTIFF